MSQVGQQLPVVHDSFGAAKSVILQNWLRETGNSKWNGARLTTSKGFGIFGGGSIQGLGDQHRMWSFFACAKHVGDGGTIEDIELVTDRLYARYISLSQLPAARVVMAALAKAFSAI